jgi:uncharacterized Ntn-hydrolase superfamily protein
VIVLGLEPERNPAVGGAAEDALILAGELEGARETRQVAVVWERGRRYAGVRD